MQIIESKEEEIKSLEKNYNENYRFENIKNEIFAQNKQLKELLLKWGLQDTINVVSFRFNLSFNEMNLDLFIQDFFNDQNVRYQLSQFISFGQENLTSIQIKKVKCSQISLDLFNKLTENQIVVKDYIKKRFDEVFEQIEINDLLREAILLEESEHYSVFSDEDRNEFLFRVFQHLVLGGSCCQYEDNLTPYLEQTKYLYKNLTSVRKDSGTGQIFIESQVYEIKKIQKIFPEAEHPQTFLYLVVSPSLRTVNVFYNKWVKSW